MLSIFCEFLWLIGKPDIINVGGGCDPLLKLVKKQFDINNINFNVGRNRSLIEQNELNSRSISTRGGSTSAKWKLLDILKEEQGILDSKHYLPRNLITWMLYTYTQG